MTESIAIRPSVIESVEQWMQNLNRSSTPCFLCKHKAGGEDLLELTCNAFPGTLIPPFIYNASVNHNEKFKGNARKTNVFTNRYAGQKTEKVFEFDNSFSIINELLAHPYTSFINEADKKGAEAFRRDIKEAIKRVKPSKDVE